MREEGSEDETDSFGEVDAFACVRSGLNEEMREGRCCSFDNKKSRMQPTRGTTDLEQVLEDTRALGGGVKVPGAGGRELDNCGDGRVRGECGIGVR